MPAIVIVGAGECGTRAAFALREEGWDGRIVLVGTEPPYERPPLSKTGEYKLICGGAALSEAGITFLPGVEATGLDTAGHALELADGRRLAYRSLLLATGARARRLPFGGAPVHLLRGHADSAALRAKLAPGRRVAVIGGGFIGLELAASAAALGCRVTVVELGPRLMGRGVPARVAAVMAGRHVRMGVDIRCGTGVTGLAETASGVTITLAEGTAIEADVVVAGVGAVPETSLAWAAGIETADGVVVDARFATSAADVFAAGDCCRYPHPLYDGRLLRLESWRAAQEHGAAAARAMLGGTQLNGVEPYAGVPWFWSDQHGYTLQVAGLAAAADREVVRVRPDGVEVWFGLADGGRLVAAAAAGPGNSVARDIRLAEMLIARRAAPDPAVLADPGAALKSVLRAPVAG
ncbi:MAG TPA: FAD-dependent oxidoreductase [Streptosporangiaceae bacterium]|nr:FAD-dependent oxidoreductase [Streptosporangiaceae bacterium]